MENEQTGQLAQIAYEVYAEHQNWKNFAGNPIPQWAEVRPDIKRAWHVVVQTILDLTKT